MSSHHEVHLQHFFNQNAEKAQNLIRYYKQCLKVVFNDPPFERQTSKKANGEPLTIVKPNFLCLQCNVITNIKSRLDHGEEKKHRFCMDLILAGGR